LLCYSLLDYSVITQSSSLSTYIIMDKGDLLPPEPPYDESFFTEAQLLAYQRHEAEVTNLENHIIASIAHPSQSRRTPARTQKLKMAERIIFIRLMNLHRRETYLEDVRSVDALQVRPADCANCSC